METILWDFLMFYHFFFSPQVKRSAVTINKQGVYKLPHELPNNLRLKNDCRSSRENIYNLKMKIKNCSNQICEKCLIKKWREDRQQAKGVPERGKPIRNLRDSENLWESLKNFMVHINISCFFSSLNFWSPYNSICTSKSFIRISQLSL